MVRRENISTTRRHKKGVKLSPCSEFLRLSDVILSLLHQISSQIHDKTQTRNLGSQLTGRGGASADVAPSESLLLWLSQHYVSSPDLQVALASLEHSILQNITKQQDSNVGNGAKAALSQEVRRKGHGSP